MIRAATVVILASGLALAGSSRGAMPPAAAQGGPAELVVGTAVTVGLALVAEVKEAIQSYGTAIVYAKAKIDGPDADDRAIDYDSDADKGLDWNLDAATDYIGDGTNGTDDGNERPYGPGFAHGAYAELHFDSTGGQWKPAPEDCVLCPEGKKQEFHLAAYAFADDDPEKDAEKTTAAAAAAFSVDGKTVDFCYSSARDESGGYVKPKKVKCPDDKPAAAALAQARAANLAPEPRPAPDGRRARLMTGIPGPRPAGPSQGEAPRFALEHAAALLVSAERFSFEPAGDDWVLLRPRIGPVVDLHHSYLQPAEDTTLLASTDGLDPEVKALVEESYRERAAEGGWSVVPQGEALAYLTVAAIAVELRPQPLLRQGRTDLELLEEYFGDPGSVAVVAPRGAQTGYHPRVLRRRVVHGGENVASLLGRPVHLPVGGDHAAGRAKPIVGLAVVVAADIDDAVALALDTPGHPLRVLADATAAEREFAVLLPYAELGPGATPAGRVRLMPERPGRLSTGSAAMGAGRRALAEAGVVSFRVPAMNFHFESPSSVSDIALASPQSEEPTAIPGEPTVEPRPSVTATATPSRTAPPTPDVSATATATPTSTSATPQPNQPPHVPSVPFPSDGASGVACGPTTLRWQGGDPDAGDELTYDLYRVAARDASEAPPPELVLSGLPASAVTILPTGRLELWQVVARDQTGAATAGPVWRFATGPWVELLANGGFESGPAAWRQLSNAPEPLGLIWDFNLVPGHLPGHAPPEGTWFTWLANRPAAQDVVYQSFQLPVRTSIIEVAYAWLMSSDKAAAAADRLAVTLGIGGQSTLLEQVDPSGARESWRRSRWPLFLPGGAAGAAELRFDARTDAAARTTEWHTDDTAVQACRAAAPSPRTVFVHPLSVIRGRPLYAEGRGFTPGAGIASWVVLPDGRRQDLAPAVADAAGTFLLGLTTGDSTPTGTYRLVSEESVGGAVAGTYFAVR